MIYLFAKNINPNKIFIINRSEFEGRCEPEFYKPYYQQLLTTIRTRSHFKLKDIICFSTETWNQKDYFQNFFPYIEISEIDLTDGEIRNFKEIELKDAPSRARMIVRKNDILISTTRPTRGAISFLKNVEGIKIASTGFAIIRKVDESKFRREALFTILRLPFVLNQMGQRSSGGNYPAITQDELGKIVLPQVDLDVQQEIISSYQNAYLQKQQKVTEAMLLLTRIDTYILNELGITLPKNTNTLQDRIYSTSFSELTGGRIDSYFYQRNFLYFFDSLKSAKYPVIALKKMSQKITSGVTPLSGGDAYTTPEEGIPFIRSGNIDINGDIEFEDLLYIKNETHFSLMKSSQVKFNDLMIAIVGATIGQVGIYKSYREANINQAIALVRLKPGYNPDFIKEVIKSSIGQYNLNRLKRPVARANINLEEISTMQLVVPPIKKQEEIADKISQIRMQAKLLFKEAESILNSARISIEKKILGV